MKEWWELMRKREAARRHPDEAAGRRAARQRPARRQRDHHDRLGHDHDLGGAAHPDAAGHAVLVLRQPGDHGARTALCHRGAGRLPRPAGGRLRRRRRLHDAEGEFITAVKYKLPIKVVIIKNNMLGQIKWEQMVFLGNPEYGVELQPIDFVKYAEACGGDGFTLREPDEVRRDRRGVRGPGPAVVEAWSTRTSRRMPGQATIKQAAFAEALARGEPTAAEIDPLTSVPKDKSPRGASGSLQRIRPRTHGRAI